MKELRLVLEGLLVLELVFGMGYLCYWLDLRRLRLDVWRLRLIVW